MKSRFFFRPTGTVIRTTLAPTRLFVLLACMFVLGLYGLAQMLDDTPSTQTLAADHEADVRAAFNAGRAKGHADMMASAKAAWDMAQLEADRCRVARGQP